MRRLTFSAGILATALLLAVVMTVWPMDAAGGQLSLSWLDTSGDALGFSVERSGEITGPFSAIATTGPGTTTYSDVSLDDSTSYCYRVKAFTSVGDSNYSYPACGATAPSGLTVALNINQDVFTLGDRFQLDVNFAQHGAVLLVDVYVGSVLPTPEDSSADCPGGDPVVYVFDAPSGLRGLSGSCLSDNAGVGAVPLYANTSAATLPSLMGRNVFSFDWPTVTPGDYTVFITVTRTGTSSVVAQSTVTISYVP